MANDMHMSNEFVKRKKIVHRDDECRKKKSSDSQQCVFVCYSISVSNAIAQKWSLHPDMR